MSQLSQLQSKFKCRKCGRCCAVGGDMELTAADIAQIANYYETLPENIVDMYLTAVNSAEGNYKLKQQRPCIFFNGACGLCMVNDAKPQACKDYPFTLLEKKGCSFEAVLICPEARRLIQCLLEESSSSTS